MRSRSHSLGELITLRLWNYHTQAQIPITLCLIRTSDSKDNRVIQFKEILRVMMIRKLVQKVLRTGYLTVEMEEQLRQLYSFSCELDDIDALADLQYAVMAGHVKREPLPMLQEYVAS